MKITLNGQPHTLPEQTTIAALVEALGLDPSGVAVAVDLSVVPRSEHAGRTLTEGQRVDVIRAVGGG